MTAAEVCRRLGYSKSTTYRLLTDLRAHKFIIRDSSGLLRLGPFPGRRNIATTNSVLEHLRTMTGESVQLWVRVGEDRVCVRNVEADHELRVSRGVGAVLPLVDGGSAALALCGPGNPAEFYATKQARVAGTASASVAFTVGAIVFALCVSYPLTREPDNVAGAYRNLLSRAAIELRALLDGSEELEVLRDIARLALGARKQAGEERQGSDERVRVQANGLRSKRPHARKSMAARNSKSPSRSQYSDRRMRSVTAPDI